MGNRSREDLLAWCWAVGFQTAPSRTYSFCFLPLKIPGDTCLDPCCLQLGTYSTLSTLSRSYRPPWMPWIYLQSDIHTTDRPTGIWSILKPQE